MKKIKYIVCYFFYQLFKWGPKSTAHTPTKGKLRTFFAKGMMSQAGKHINVERGACFSRRLSIGDYSGIGVNCQIQGKVTIGSNVMIGQDVLIYTSNHSFDRTDIPMREQKYQEERPVVIGNDVWIGARVIILPGVSIGDGVVIGAGSIVTKDIPPYSVCAGNPARVIKERK